MNRYVFSRSLLNICLANIYILHIYPLPYTRTTDKFLSDPFFHCMNNRNVENNKLSGDVLSLANCLSLTNLWVHHPPNVLLLVSKWVCDVAVELILFYLCRNVSYNSLAGDIPIGNNFSRFSPERLDNQLTSL